MTIARATQAQSGTVGTLLVEAARWLESQGVHQWRPDDFTVPWVAERIAAGELWLARIDEAPAGAFRLRESDPDLWPDAVEGEALYLSTLTVARPFAGVGRALLAFAEGEAHRRGRTFLRLDCWAGNDRLIAYYRAAGFVDRGERREQTWEVRRFERPIG